MTLMDEAYAAANMLWAHIKDSKRAAEAAVEEMRQRERQTEELLCQQIPTRPRRTPLQPLANGIESSPYLRPNAEPFHPRNETRFPGIEIDLSGTSFAQADAMEIRKVFDQAVRKYEGTKSIQCRGLTRNMTNASIVRLLLQTGEDEGKVRKDQAWLGEFHGGRLRTGRPCPVKVARVNKLALFSQPGGIALREDASKIISEENGIDVAWVKWLGDYPGTQHGLAVIYLTRRDEADTILRERTINIGGETAFTKVFYTRY
jgi:hypothetical protein